MVFQHFHLFPLYVENLTLSPIHAKKYQEAEKIAMHYLSESCTLQNKLPNTPQLSGGLFLPTNEWLSHRLRLCMKPEIMLFDIQLQSAIRDDQRRCLDGWLIRRAKVSPWCVTHEMGFAKQVADRVIFSGDEAGKL
ncbi:hypothetical protein O9929_26565 [Vibrio lentus]|nr:hypothetical protein [Vibrio lentus]